MFRLAPAQVHETLRRHLLATGHPIVLDLQNSHGAFAQDALTGDEYLDFAGFYASNALGFNHPALDEPETREALRLAASIKVGNPDFYTCELASFIHMLERTAGLPTHPHYFFVEGGALGVENALKTAMDWKVQKNLARGLGEIGTEILHFENAFHGRSGYTLSVTNTDPAKTRYFPKFDWPRMPCPAARFPLLSDNLRVTEELERQSIAAVERAFDERPNRIAGILIEPIQGEGGDNHFRAEFLRALREIADAREALLIFDEVQTGVGITGRWWAHEHAQVKPDILCFAKKLQVGGFFASTRIDDVESVFKVPSRISSTWGGALVDMVRATRILQVIEEESLLTNAEERGRELLSGLSEIQQEHPGLLRNARGLGLLCAIDVALTEQRNSLVKRCFNQRLLVLAGGTHTIRFRPSLTIDADALKNALIRFRSALNAVS